MDKPERRVNMHIKPREWLAFTKDERMIVLRFVVEENKKRWGKRKAALAEATH